MKIRILGLALAIFALHNSAAAPCCGGGATFPALIAGDERISVGLNYSFGAIIGDAPAEGVPLFRSDRDDESTQIVQVAGATLLSDRWQVGAQTSIVNRSRQTPTTQDASTRFGDTALSLAYEALPEWEYSAWKPRGLTYLQLVLPTGRSIYEIQSPLGVDSSGKGFYALSLGALATKVIDLYDFSVNAQLGYAFARGFGSTRIGSAAQASLSFGAGASPDFAQGVRIGLSIAPVWENSRVVRSSGIDSRSASQLVWNVGAGLSRSLGRVWTVALNYTDQTLLGPVRNVSLSRSVALNIQRRWER